MKISRLGGGWAGLILTTGLAWAEPASKMGAADQLRVTYVDGLQVVSDVQAMLARTENLLQLQEAATDGHVERLNGVEWRVKSAKYQLEALEKEVARSGGERERMLGEYARILERFSVLDRALADRNALLAGATDATSKLMELADKTGRLNERQLVERMVAEMKATAEHFQRICDRLDDAKLRIGLEHTLVQGMGSRLPVLAQEVERLLQEQAALAGQVVEYRVAVAKLEQGVQADRASLDGKLAEFARTTEGFRVVQVDVLRRWLLSGPPEGDWPALSSLDMLEAGLAGRKPKQPDPSATAMGATGGGMRGMGGEGVNGNLVAGAGLESRDEDQPQGAPELVRQYKRVRWYQAMILRLVELTRESVSDAEGWTEQSRQWNTQHMEHNRELAQQQGALAGLAAELKTTGLTVELTVKQAETVSAKVAEAVSALEKQTAALGKITTKLRDLAK